MRQIVHDVQRGTVRVAEVPAPSPLQGQVLIQVHHSLVSAGTERTVVDFAESSLIGKARRRPDLVVQVMDKVKRDGIMPTWEAVTSRLRQPLTLGYAVAGTVMAVGPDVEQFAVGDAVAAAGANHAVHAEVVSVPKNLVVKLPRGVGFEAGCFTTVGAIALQGVRVADVKLGEYVAVIGLGLLGQITTQLLTAAGCRVIGFDVRADRVQLAREGGAECATDRTEEFESLCRARTRGHGVDAVLITAATTDNRPVTLAGQVARDKGVVVAVGAVGLDVPRKVFYEKELDLRLSRSYGPGRYDRSYEEEGHDYPYGYVRWTEQRNMEAFLRFVAQSQVDVQRLITHRFTVDEARRAYDVLAGRAGEPALGIVVEYPQIEPARPATRIETGHGRAGTTAPGAGRVGLIGSGAFASRVLLPGLRRANAEFVSVCARSGISARHAADTFKFQSCTTDADELLRDSSIDSVVIASPHNLHASQVSSALRAGKHVFVEKPLCLNETELAQIEDEHRRAGRILLVGFNRRFAPMAIALKRFLDDIAEPVSIQYRVNAGYIPPEHWTQDPLVGGGRLVGEAVHFIDLAGWLAGAAPMAVEAYGLPDSGRYRGDNFTIDLRYPNGSIAQIVYVANGHRGLGKERLEVHGGGRSAVLEDFRRLRLFGRRTTTSRLWLGSDKGHNAECRAFIDAVRTGGPSPIPFDEIAASMRAAFTARARLNHHSLVQ